jgi:hypothetical protein
MSRSFDVSITLSFRTVFSSEQEKEVVRAIEEAKKALANPEGISKQRLGTCKAVVEASEKGLDAVFSTFLKDAAKQIRQVVIEETQHDGFKNFAPPVVVITPRVNRGPVAEVPLSSRWTETV